METKIVYALSSNDSDVYLEYALVSVYSVRQYMPDTEVILVVDDLTDNTIRGKRGKILDYVTSKIVVPIEEKYNLHQRSRILKTSLREYIDGDFLFIDADTIITSSLEGIDAFPYDIGAVKDRHVLIEECSDLLKDLKFYAKLLNWPIDQEPYWFNSGVIYVKDNHRTRQFYKSWHDYWRKSLAYGVNKDQPAFSMANIKNNYCIHELSGIWNCQMYYGVKYFSESKIIHYYGSLSNEFLAEFTDRNFFLEIKSQGDLTGKAIRIVKNPLNYFVNSICVLYGRGMRFWHTPTAIHLFSIYRKHHTIFNFINAVIEFASKIKNRAGILLRR